jgi:hypothetical protein
MRPLVSPSAIRIMAMREGPIDDDMPRRSVDRPIEEKARSRVGRWLAGRLHLWQRVRRLDRDAEVAGQVVELSQRPVASRPRG